MLRTCIAIVSRESDSGVEGADGTDRFLAIVKNVFGRGNPSGFFESFLAVTALARAGSDPKPAFLDRFDCLKDRFLAGEIASDGVERELVQIRTEIESSWSRLVRRTAWKEDRPRGRN